MRSETNRPAVDERNTTVEPKRRYPIGAELIGANQTHFRVWAPKAHDVDLVLEESADQNAKRSFQSLEREGGGYFSGKANVGAGSLYRFRVNKAEHFHPDPASRFQPYGPHGSSCIVDPAQFKWTDSDWRGVKMKGQIIYEMHVGTFTKEGTWRAATEQLAELARIGITVVEMMPIADFPGNFGWGYDGVDLFAPSHLYGTPDDLRQFIDHAHSLGLGVILDVVYNHFGPDGNYLAIYSGDYLIRENETDWGDSINFDGPNSARSGNFSSPTAATGSTNSISMAFVSTPPTRFMISRTNTSSAQLDAPRAKPPRRRSIVLIAENERQVTKLIRPRSEGGDDLDAVWNDDFHHSAAVALTGRREAYYTDYLGTPQEFISAAKYGYLFQGQPYFWQEAPRGTPTFGSPPHAFVAFIENHDQVSNTATGERLRFQSSPGRYRAMTALLLLGPWTPLLFQGEEFGASTPFVFFTDVGDGPMREAIRKGRFAFLAQFPSLATKEVQERLPVPSDPTSFVSCKLDFSERQKNTGTLRSAHRSSAIAPRRFALSRTNTERRRRRRPWTSQLCPSLFQ